jgi:hypothetical protein
MQGIGRHRVPALAQTPGQESNVQLDEGLAYIEGYDCPRHGPFYTARAGILVT